VEQGGERCEAGVARGDAGRGAVHHAHRRRDVLEESTIAAFVRGVEEARVILVMTAPTPMMMPSIVSAARNRFARID
jgi:hypothetical protein